MNYTTKYCPGCYQTLRPFSNCCPQNNNPCALPKSNTNRCQQTHCNCCGLTCQNLIFFIAGTIFSNNKR
ncbi:MAG: hypothetical protein J6J24_01290 [Clostridia bacterium]|nr:hypothetical protein [Clostridia bacterium]